MLKNDHTHQEYLGLLLLNNKKHLLKLIMYFANQESLKPRTKLNSYNTWGI